MSWATDIPDVVAGQPITSAWGNLIRDRVVHNVATVAALPSTGMDNGEVAYVAADGLLYIRHAAKWWTRKTVDVTKTTDANGIVTMTAAELGFVTVTKAFATGASSSGPGSHAWTASHYTAAGATARCYAWNPATGAVTRPGSVSVTLQVFVEGYVTA